MINLMPEEGLACLSSPKNLCTSQIWSTFVKISRKKNSEAKLNDCLKTHTNNDIKIIIIT